MLKEIQMTVAFRLGIIRRMQTINTWVREPRASLKINLDGEDFLRLLKLNIANVPRFLYAQGGFKEGIHHERDLSIGRHECG